MNDTKDTCKDCGETALEHQDEHPWRCCDCFDLACGMPIESLNKERLAKGKPPLAPRSPTDS